MVRGTIASEIRDVIARQEGEWAVAEIRDMVSGATASKVLVVVMRLVEQGLVQRIGYSRGPNSKVRPTYMTMGDIPLLGDPPATDPEEILAGLMAGRRYEDVKLKVTGRLAR